MKKTYLPHSFILALSIFTSCTEESSEENNGESSAEGGSSSAEVVTLVAPDAGFDPSLASPAKVAPHPIAERFPAAASADSLVVLIDAMGIRPLDKEQLMIASILQPSSTIAVLHGTKSFGRKDNIQRDVPALLKKRVAEVEELGKLHGVENLTVAADSLEAEGEFAIKGWEAILSEAAKAEPKSALTREATSKVTASVTIPKMSESHAPHAIQTLKNGKKADLVFASGVTKVEVECDNPITPGSSGIATLILPEDIELGVGERFVITRMGSVIGHGEITDL